MGTLIHSDPDVASIYAAAGRAHSSHCDGAAITTHFRQAFARHEAIDRDNGWRTDEVREMARWRAIVCEVFPDLSPAAAELCFAQLYRHFGHGSAWRVDADVAMVTAAAKARGYQLAIASNFDSRLHAVISEHHALHPFDHCIVSSEIGWRKPAPEFFSQVCRTLECVPHEILFVGDDWENDVQAARQAGMHAILFDPRHRYMEEPTKIERLAELFH